MCNEEFYPISSDIFKKRFSDVVNTKPDYSTSTSCHREIDAIISPVSLHISTKTSHSTDEGITCDDENDSLFQSAQSEEDLQSIYLECQEEISMKKRTSQRSCETARYSKTNGIRSSKNINLIPNRIRIDQSKMNQKKIKTKPLSLTTKKNSKFDEIDIHRFDRIDLFRSL